MPLLYERHNPRLALPDQIPTTVRKNARSASSAITIIGIILSVWLVTEFVAWRLAFAPVLNAQAIAPHLFPHLYYPWAVAFWFSTLSSALRDPTSRQDFIVLCVQTLLVFLGALTATIAAAIGIYVLTLRKAPRVNDLHGSAQWADAADFGEMELLPPGHTAIKAANARAKREGREASWADDASLEAWRRKPGVYLGEWVDDAGTRHWLRDVSDRHIIVTAPTRSGKGVSVGVPACLEWPGSLVVNDPKGELYQLSAHYRKHELGQRIFVLDPTCTDGNASRYNVLSSIRLGTEFEIADTQNISTMLCDPLGLGETGSSDDYWKFAAAELFTGLTLHALLSNDVLEKNLAGIDALRSDPSRELDDLCRDMLHAIHDPEFKRGWTDFRGYPTMTHPTVSKVARNMLQRADKEQSGVYGSLGRYLELYTDPIIAANTATSDFSIEDLMRGDRPCTLYIINTPDNMRRLRPYMRLLVNTIVTVFCGRLEFDASMRPKPNYKWPLLLLLDEACDALGRMDILSQNLTFLAGYGIKVLMILQNRAQLDATYTTQRANTMLANFHTQIYYATNDPSTQRQVSDMAGERTLRHETISYGQDNKTSRSESISARSLLKPNEVQSLDPAKEVMFCAGHRPAMLDRIIYWKEAIFSARLHPPIERDGTPIRCDRIPVDEQARTIEARPFVEKAIRDAAQRIQETRVRLQVDGPAPATDTTAADTLDTYIH